MGYPCLGGFFLGFGVLGIERIRGLIEHSHTGIERIGGCIEHLPKCIERMARAIERLGGYIERLAEFEQISDHIERTQKRPQH